MKVELNSINKSIQDISIELFGPKIQKTTKFKESSRFELYSLVTTSGTDFFISDYKTKNEFEYKTLFLKKKHTRGCVIY